MNPAHIPNVMRESQQQAAKANASMGGRSSFQFNLPTSKPHVPGPPPVPRGHQRSSSKGEMSSYSSASPASSRGSSRKARRARGVKPYSPNDLKLRRKVRKNTREKQRRQELNDKFDELAVMLNLGRKTKIEKYTVLTEAITTLIQLRQENEEIRKEKSELRAELAKLTNCLSSAFPNQPDYPTPSTPMNKPSDSFITAMKVSSGQELSHSHDVMSPMMTGDLPPIPKLEAETMPAFGSSMMDMSDGAPAPPGTTNYNGSMHMSQSHGNNGFTPSFPTSAFGSSKLSLGGRNTELNQSLMNQLNRMSSPPADLYPIDGVEMDTEFDYLSVNPFSIS